MENISWKQWDNQPNYSLDQNKQYGTLTVAEYNRLKSIEENQLKVINCLKNCLFIVKDYQKSLENISFQEIIRESENVILNFNTAQPKTKKGGDDEAGSILR